MKIHHLTAMVLQLGTAALFLTGCNSNNYTPGDNNASLSTGQLDWNAQDGLHRPRVDDATVLANFYEVTDNLGLRLKEESLLRNLRSTVPAWFNSAYSSYQTKFPSQTDSVESAWQEYSVDNSDLNIHMDEFIEKTNYFGDPPEWFSNAYMNENFNGLSQKEAWDSYNMQTLPQEQQSEFNEWHSFDNGADEFFSTVSENESFFSSDEIDCNLEGDTHIINEADQSIGTFPEDMHFFPEEKVSDLSGAVPMGLDIFTMVITMAYAQQAGAITDEASRYLKNLSYNLYTIGKQTQDLSTQASTILSQQAEISENEALEGSVYTNEIMPALGNINSSISTLTMQVYRFNEDIHTKLSALDNTITSTFMLEDYLSAKITEEQTVNLYLDEMAKYNKLIDETIEPFWQRYNNTVGYYGVLDLNKTLQEQYGALYQFYEDNKDEINVLQKISSELSGVRTIDANYINGKHGAQLDDLEKHLNEGADTSYVKLQTYLINVAYDRISEDYFKSETDSIALLKQSNAKAVALMLRSLQALLKIYTIEVSLLYSYHFQQLLSNDGLPTYFDSAFVEAVKESPSQLTSSQRFTKFKFDTHYIKAATSLQDFSSNMAHLSKMLAYRINMLKLQTLRHMFNDASLLEATLDSPASAIKAFPFISAKFIDKNKNNSALGVFPKGTWSEYCNVFRIQGEEANVTNTSFVGYFDGTNMKTQCRLVNQKTSTELSVLRAHTLSNAQQCFKDGNLSFFYNPDNNLSFLQCSLNRDTYETLPVLPQSNVIQTAPFDTDMTTYQYANNMNQSYFSIMTGASIYLESNVADVELSLFAADEFVEQDQNITSFGMKPNDSKRIVFTLNNSKNGYSEKFPVDIRMLWQLTYPNDPNDHYMQSASLTLSCFDNGEFLMQPNQRKTCEVIPNSGIHTTTPYSEICLGGYRIAAQVLPNADSVNASGNSIGMISPSRLKLVVTGECPEAAVAHLCNGINTSLKGYEAICTH